MSNRVKLNALLESNIKASVVSTKYLKIAIFSIRNPSSYDDFAICSCTKSLNLESETAYICRIVMQTVWRSSAYDTLFRLIITSSKSTFFTYAQLRTPHGKPNFGGSGRVIQVQVRRPNIIQKMGQHWFIPFRDSTTSIISSHTELHLIRLEPIGNTVYTKHTLNLQRDYSSNPI